MIQRAILPDLEKHLSEPEITILIGPRQVGKTTLMQTLQTRLDREGEKTVFLNLDIEDHKEFFTSQTALLSYIRLHAGVGRAYVFLDEIQRKENAGVFLKGLYDMHTPYKFIVSGSGSLDLHAKIKEALAGRKRLFIIEPVSFEEFVLYRTGYAYTQTLNDFFELETIKTQSFLEEYMKFGGYPRVILAETMEKKKHEMDELYRSYIDRDIRDLLGVQKPDAFTSLLKILASQIGGLINVHELSSTVGIAEKTIGQYLWYLEETFIIKKVTPFYKNIRSEISKAPVYYFCDLGMRNYLLGLFGIPAIPPALGGHLFENVIFSIIRSHVHAPSISIHFWRTRDNAEVDFVVQAGLDFIPVEVKYTKLTHTVTTRSFKSFLDRYHPAKGYIIHVGKKLEDTYAGTKISFIPYYESANIPKSLHSEDTEMVK